MEIKLETKKGTIETYGSERYDGHSVEILEVLILGESVRVNALLSNGVALENINILSYTRELDGVWLEEEDAFLALAEDGLIPCNLEKFKEAMGHLNKLKSAVEEYSIAMKAMGGLQAETGCHDSYEAWLLVPGVPVRFPR